MRADAEASARGGFCLFSHSLFMAWVYELNLSLSGLQPFPLAVTEFIPTRRESKREIFVCLNFHFLNLKYQPNHYIRIGQQDIPAEYS